jgi:hypothetical protein
MIYLQIDDDMTEVDSWETIVNRPNFVKDFDVKDKILEKIIGYYDLKEKTTCGICSCHTAHNKGYIVLTNDGNETNIGNHCGKKYFHVAFENMSAEFMNAVEYEKLMAQVSAQKPNVFELWNKINELTVGNKNINWAIKNLKCINNPDVIGRSAFNELRAIAARGKGDVIFARPPTKDEIDLAEISGQKAPQSVDVVVGMISHIECITLGSSLEELFENSLRKPVQLLQDCDVNKSSRLKLRDVARGINSLDSNILFAKEKINLARAFFQKENLKQLLNTLSQNRNVSKADIDHYTSFIETL